MGLYPGGQSGYPGSKWFDNMVNGWVEGEMYDFYSSGEIDQIPGYKISITGEEK